MIDLPVLRTSAGETITRFRPDHLWRINMKEPFLSEAKRDPGYLDAIARYANPDASWTGMYRSKPVLCFGLRVVNPGVAEAWMLPGKEITDHSISLARGSRKIFQHYLDQGVFRRIQIGVDSGHDSALRFARWMGFEVEGIMRKFGADGADHIMLSRISDHGT